MSLLQKQIVSPFNCLNSLWTKTYYPCNILSINNNFLCSKKLKKYINLCGFRVIFQILVHRQNLWFCHWLFLVQSFTFNQIFLIFFLKKVDTQYKDLRAALVGQGDYELCSQFKKYEVKIDVWAKLPKERRDRHFQKFMLQTSLTESRTVITTDGKQFRTGPGKNGGKNPIREKEGEMPKLHLSQRKNNLCHVIFKSVNISILLMYLQFLFVL